MTALLSHTLAFLPTTPLKQATQVPPVTPQRSLRPIRKQPPLPPRGSLLTLPGDGHRSGQKTTRHYVTVGGKKGHYTTIGGEDSPTVVLLCSQLIHTRSYRWTVEVLSNDFRCFTVELPGSGSSDRVQHPWTTRQYAEWVVQFMDAVGIERATVIGHSASGAPALEAARLFPHRVENLVLADSIGANAPDFLPRLLLMRFLDAFLELQFSIPGVFHILSNAVRHPLNFLNQIATSAYLDLREPARQVHVPTLLAWGRRDKTIPLYCAVRFWRELPQGTVYMSEEGSHNWLIQRPEEFHKALCDFVFKNDKRSAVTSPKSPLQKELLDKCA